MIPILLTAALASPGGYRVGPGAPGDLASLREAVAIDPEYGISQTTLHGRVTLGSEAVLEAQLPLVVGWDPQWSEVGLGQLRLGARWFVRYDDAWGWSLGAELGFPVSPRTAQVSMWATSSRETLAAFEAIAVAEVWALPRFPLVVRLGLGWHEGPWNVLWALSDERGLSAELMLAQVYPVAGPFSLVGEVDVAIDRFPASLRALARLDPFEALSVDLGVQTSITDRVLFVPIGQVRALF